MSTFVLNIHKNQKPKEEQEWYTFALQSFESAYSNEEPDISNLPVKVPNSDFKSK